MYLDLSRRHDWPVKKAIVDLPIKVKGNLKRTSGNWLSPLGAQNKDIGSAPLDVTNTPLRTITVKFNFPKASVMEAKFQSMSRYCQVSFSAVLLR